jgi:Zn-dependent protease with chaperone function
MAAAIYFDGMTARRHPVEVALGAATLDLSEAGELLARWPLPSLRELGAVAGEMRLTSTEAPELANLVVRDPALVTTLKARLPNLLRDAAQHQPGTLKIVVLSLAAVASIFALIVYAIPLLSDRIALLVPPSLERRLGETVAQQVISQFDGKVCSSPAGDRALQKLSGLLSKRSDLRHPIRISVLGTPVLNAIALPGGNLFLFDGLLQKARNVDEVAGVLGHEIGHDVNRDVMRGMIRSGGTAFLLGLLLGDVTGSWAVIFVSRQLFDAAHSREAETMADDHGRAVMHDLGRPAAEMAKLLVRISGEEKGRGNIFASHPMSKDRLERLEKADAALGRPLAGRPLLSPEEWQALRRICSAD